MITSVPFYFFFLQLNVLWRRQYTYENDYNLWSFIVNFEWIIVLNLQSCDRNLILDWLKSGNQIFKKITDTIFNITLELFVLQHTNLNLKWKDENAKRNISLYHVA